MSRAGGRLRTIPENEGLLTSRDYTPFPFLDAINGAAPYYKISTTPLFFAPYRLPSPSQTSVLVRTRSADQGIYLF